MCEICNGAPNCPCCSTPRYETCPECSGTGRDEWGFSCPNCDGEGTVEIEPYYYDDYEPNEDS